MAFSKLFTCNQCEFDAVLIHAAEWTMGPDGEIIEYPGHGPIHGLVNYLWCEGCRTVRPYPFVRLFPPGDHAVIAYAEAQRLGRDGTEIGPCLVCEKPLTWKLDGAICPRCETGTLHFTGEWEDAV